VLAQRLDSRRKNAPRAGRPDPAKTVERESSDENMTEDDPEMQTPIGSRAVSSRRRRLHWWADADLETRKAYGRALMSGHGILHFLSSKS
jgi:hypothetical protein